MIRLGRYDAFDKWRIVCRAWAGEVIDVGVSRRGNRSALLDWQEAASSGGSRCLYNYIVQKYEAAATLATGGTAPSDELVRLVQQTGPFDLWSDAQKLIADLKSSGFDKKLPHTELPEAIVECVKEAFKLGALQALHWTDGEREIPGLEMLRAEKRAFPHAALKGKRNVLSMFCAEQLGMIDVIHIHDAAPDHVTLLDSNTARMQGMQEIYPAEWTYVCADYHEFLREAEERELSYDLIVADPWRLMCAEVAFDMLPTIMRRCTDVLVIHYVQEMFDELDAAPEDFAGLSHAIKRRTGVDVSVTEWTPRSSENGWLVMRNRSGPPPKPFSTAATTWSLRAFLSRKAGSNS